MLQAYQFWTWGFFILHAQRSAFILSFMKTILVVDDETRITQLARDYLTHAGFAVVTAHDGPGALATFRAERPDLVVLDLGLPGLDGLDVTRALRRDSNVPVIMLTAPRLLVFSKRVRFIASARVVHRFSALWPFLARFSSSR